MSMISPIICAAEFEAVAITTTVDLFQMTPVVDRPIIVYGMDLFQTTDLADAAEEVLRIGLYRDVTAGSGGTAETEYVYTNVAAGVTPTCAVVTLNTTASTGGTLIHPFGWNIRIPMEWRPIPEMRPKFSNIAAEGPVSSFRLVAAPTDSLTVSGVLFWSEI